MKFLGFPFPQSARIDLEEIRRRLFSFGRWLEQKLEQERDQLPLWLPIAFGSGILLWFTIPNSDGWIGCGCLLLALGLMAWPWAGQKRAAKAVFIMAIAAFLGLADIWFRSYYVAPIAPPNLGVCEVRGQILQSEQQPSRKRMRLVIEAPVYPSSLAAIDEVGEEPTSIDKNKLYQEGSGQVFGHREVAYHPDGIVARGDSFAIQMADGEKDTLPPINSGQIFTHLKAGYRQDGMVAQGDSFTDQITDAGIGKLRKVGNRDIFANQEAGFHQNRAVAKRLSFVDQAGDTDKNKLSDNRLVFANRVAAYPQDKDMAKRSSSILQFPSADKSKSYTIEGSQSFTDRVGRYRRDGTVERRDSFSDQRADADIDKLRRGDSRDIFANREVGYRQGVALVEGKAFTDEEADKAGFRRAADG